MISQSSERFFAVAIKRILVSLSCASLVVAAEIPAAFANTDLSGTEPKITDKKNVGDTSNGSATNTSKVAPTEPGSGSLTASELDLAIETKPIPVDSTAAKKIEEKAVSETKIVTDEKAASETKIVTDEKAASETKIVTDEKTVSETKIVTDEKAASQTTAVTDDKAVVDAKALTSGESKGASVEPKPETSQSASNDGNQIEGKDDGKVISIDNDAASGAAQDETAKVEPVSADSMFHADGLPDAAKIATAAPLFGSVSANKPIVIDNDEFVETEATIKYEDLETDEGKTRVKTGARFPVVISSQITSKTAKKGDAIEARLKYDLKIGDRVVAKKGAMVNGHINYCLPARSTMHSLVSPTRWYRNSGCIGLTFDEIINDKGEHLPLVAVPSRAARFVKNKGEGRELGINHDGQVTGPWAQQLRYKAVRVGLNAALAPAGAFSFGAMPIALGVMGAVNPSFAFMKPVGLNVRHRRIKGFFWGALSGVPGSWLIEDTVVKGQEAVIKPGDEFYAEFQKEFTGEPASEATMMPNAKSKVHGEVMPGKK